MPFTIVRQDITKMHVDAVVNAANTGLQMGGGVCGAIFKNAGAAELQAACDKLAPIATGEAVITPGFGLPAKFIIHTAGPVYRGGKYGEEKQLRLCYMNSLRLAAENSCDSIVFPLISGGIYGYPRDKAMSVATAAIREFLADHDMNVYLAVYDKKTFEVSKKLIGAVESYIDEHYVAEHTVTRSSQYRLETEDLDELAVFKYNAPDMMQAPSTGKGIEDLIGNLDESFSDTVLRLIDAKGKKDADIYKKANLDRKLFSKIRTGKGYIPSKRTAVALAVALELSLGETDDLLERAGFTLSHSRIFDVIVEYFIVSGNYDIFEINEVLFKYDQPLLGS